MYVYMKGNMSSTKRIAHGMRALALVGLAALAFGRAFDRRPLPTLVAVPLGSCLFAPLAFSGNLALVALATVLVAALRGWVLHPHRDGRPRPRTP